MDRKSNPERLSVFSDGVFAIVMMILVLLACGCLALYVRPLAPVVKPGAK